MKHLILGDDGTWAHQDLLDKDMTIHDQDESPLEWIAKHWRSVRFEKGDRVRYVRAMTPDGPVYAPGWGEDAHYHVVSDDGSVVEIDTGTEVVEVFNSAVCLDKRGEA